MDGGLVDRLDDCSSVLQSGPCRSPRCWSWTTFFLSRSSHRCSWMGLAGLLVVLSHTMLRFVRSQALAASDDARRDTMGAWSVVSCRPLAVSSRATAHGHRSSGADWGLDAIRGYFAVQAIGRVSRWVVCHLLVVSCCGVVADAGGAGWGRWCCCRCVWRWWASRRLWIGIEREVAADAEAQVCLAGYVAWID